MDEHQHNQPSSQPETSSGHGHSHDLDPSLFTEYAATSEPLGTIMVLHIFSMVIGNGSKITTTKTKL